MLQIIKITLQSILSIIALIVVCLVSFYGFMFLKYPEMDCQNENLIHQESTYDSKEYQLELIKLLKESDIEDTRFWLGKYIDPTHITFRMQNQNICAEGLITVHKMEGKGAFMNHLMSMKGISWGGPLIGVKFKFIEDSLHPEIILTSIDDIID